MILQSLVNYYEILANDEDSTISKPGYCSRSISYAVNISEFGELLNIIPLKIKAQRGKKTIEVPRNMMVPEQEKKTSGIKSNFLCENSAYFFGIGDKNKPERARGCFEAFRALHNDILKASKGKAAKAIINYVNNWDVNICHGHSVLTEYIDEMLAGANLVFSINGIEYAHLDEEIRDAWENHRMNIENADIMQCLVTGKKEPIAILHPAIKGVKGAQSAGGSLVSFNARAYESYGYTEKQGLNAPVSEYATFAYTTVLNYLLADMSHKMNFGDSTVVFWAESNKKIYNDFMSIYLNGGEVNKEERSEEKITDDMIASLEAMAVFKKISSGNPIGDLSDIFDVNTKFYMLAISPNAARLSIRFFLSNTFGSFVKAIGKHYEDMRIEKQYSTEPDSFSIWKLLNETVSPNSRDKTPSPLMAGSTLKAIILGGPYPASLYNSIMLRIRAEKDITYYKASIIKAYLLRKTKKYEEVLNMSLNEESNNKAYVFGRLFAVLEKAQLEANPRINTTIKDRYFTSACATPASVFPILLRLSQYHISKVEYGIVHEKRISAILEKLDIENNPFPSNLTLDEQGVFILGYYHQKNDFFKKKEKKENENE